MPLRSLDFVVDEVIGREFITRRTLMENLRPGRKYAGCARKVGNRWVFTDDDIARLLERMRYGLMEEALCAVESPLAPLLASGMSPRSPRVLKR